MQFKKKCASCEEIFTYTDEDEVVVCPKCGRKTKNLHYAPIEDKEPKDIFDEAPKMGEPRREAPRRVDSRWDEPKREVPAKKPPKVKGPGFFSTVNKPTVIASVLAVIVIGLVVLLGSFLIPRPVTPGQAATDAEIAYLNTLAKNTGSITYTVTGDEEDFTIVFSKTKNTIHYIRSSTSAETQYEVYVDFKEGKIYWVDDDEKEFENIEDVVDEELLDKENWEPIMKNMNTAFKWLDEELHEGDDYSSLLGNMYAMIKGGIDEGLFDTKIKFFGTTYLTAKKEGNKMTVSFGKYLKKLKIVAEEDDIKTTIEFKFSSPVRFKHKKSEFKEA